MTPPWLQCAWKINEISHVDDPYVEIVIEDGIRDSSFLVQFNVKSISDECNYNIITYETLDIDGVVTLKNEFIIQVEYQLTDLTAEELSSGK